MTKAQPTGHRDREATAPEEDPFADPKPVKPQKPPRPRRRRRRRAPVPIELLLESHMLDVVQWYRKQRAAARRDLIYLVHRFYKTFERRCNRVMPVLVWAPAWDAPLETGPQPLE